KNFRSGLETALGDAVIIELKQDGRAASPMKGILLDHRVNPARLSKYCIAVTLTDPSARAGRFKEKVRLLEKTIHHQISVA
ncbi:MAG: VTC domain-containing protein, partial [Bacteroidales bacterium]|nr:VTC domain-containing protein [Bacteroidales bacterium]